MIERISDMQYRILTQLAVFRFLTTDQMVRLNVCAGHSKTRLYQNLRHLADGKKPFLGSYMPEPLPNQGKLPYLHYLTPHGAERVAGVLDVSVDEIKYPHRAPMFRNQYWHVTWCVDDEISVREWAGAHGHAVDFYHSYLDTTGANRSATKDKRRNVTKIETSDGQYIIPDAVCKTTDEAGVDRLFVFEVHNQMRTKRIEKRLEDMRHALSDGAIERQFSYDASPRICTVFEHEAALSAAAKRMAGSGAFRGFEPLFYLTTHERMRQDFRYGWRHIDDTRGCALF